MPTYTYRCDFCHRPTYQLRHVDARDEARYCPDCEYGLLHRELDAPLGASFKTGGFSASSEKKGK
jgi:putative FmdB family regulatory protein